jgi:hypothetical protein
MDHRAELLAGAFGDRFQVCALCFLEIAAGLGGIEPMQSFLRLPIGIRQL